MKFAIKLSLLIICLFHLPLLAQTNKKDNIKEESINNYHKTENSLNQVHIENKPVDCRHNLKRDTKEACKPNHQSSCQHSFQDSAIKSNSGQSGFLRKNQSIVEYKIVDSSISISITNRTNVRTKTISFPDDLNLQINALRDCLTNYKMAINSPLKSYQQFTESASKLYEYLIRPIQNEITDNDLVFVLDGSLHSIPFEILLEEKPGQSEKSIINYNYLNYLFKSHKISYAYASAIPHYHIKENQGGFLGFAPDFSADTLKNIKTNGTRSFNNLLFNLEEIVNIEQYFPDARTLKGEEATEQAFYELSESFNILHFSTHAIVDDKDPENSRLVFSNSSDSDNDGYLYINELSKMKLSADMAVLAACNTGKGKINDKQSMISLGSSFLKAGCSSVVTSLWSAHDESTSLIMKHFYHFLSKGATKDAALQEAKLEYIKNADPLTIHPFYWANFVVIGNTQPIKCVSSSDKEKLRNRIYIIAIMAFVLGFVLIKKEKI